MTKDETTVDEPVLRSARVADESGATMVAEATWGSKEVVFEAEDGSGDRFERQRVRVRASAKHVRAIAKQLERLADFADADLGSVAPPRK